MTKMIVLWLILGGQPKMTAKVSVTEKMSERAAVQLCEQYALELRTYGYTVWCSPHIDL